MSVPYSAFATPAPVLPIKTISRNPADFTRQRSGDLHQHHHSLDPALHPFALAREYTRALNAVKYQKIFAKPFLHAFDGHRDAVVSISRVGNTLTSIISGAADGEIRLWHLPTRTCVWSAAAHQGFARSVCSDREGRYVFSCSSDQTVKMWKVEQTTEERQEEEEDNEARLPSSLSSTSVSSPSILSSSVKPTTVFLGANAFNCMSHHATDCVFAAASSVISVYDSSRSEPQHSFTWGADTINTIQFSPVETNILLSTSADRTVILYDIRARTPLKRILMLKQSNAVCWSPTEAYYFTTGNEDHNAYTFDMRALDHAVMIHQDHVSAIMSIDYSPTGKAFATGSYDRTVRIFDSATTGVSHSSSSVSAGGGHSKEVYHTKRMQRVFGVCWTWDSQYLLSASDDTNIRLWKANASQKLGITTPRERQAINYRTKLIERFSAVDEVKRIHHHRHLPKAILKAKQLKAEMSESERRKAERVRKHSRPGSEATQFVSVKKRTVRKEIE